jgi:hypothetical protein
VTGLLLTLSLFSLGFEAGAGATLEKGLGKDIEDYKPAISFCAELGVRDILPGIGLDLGFRRFGVERTIMEDTLEKHRRWEGYFFDASAVFESWPYLAGPFGIKLRTGGFYAPWMMLEDGVVIAIPPKDTLSDTVFMQAQNIGVLLGGSVMFKPCKFLILDLGVNHRHVFSMDVDKFGKDDVDERFMEVYLAARFRF